MRRIAFLPLLALALAAPARAQGPGQAPARAPMPGGGPGAMMMMHPGPGPSPAEMLLAHTGELKLTDAQVVRLAAIARRAADRHQAMHTQMMAQHPAAGRPQPPSDAEMQRMHQQMQQEHDQAHADLRDALAVLTPDQQAQAFELAHAHGPGGPGGMGPGGQHMMRMRHGPGVPGGPERRQGPPPPPRDGAAPPADARP